MSRGENDRLWEISRSPSPGACHEVKSAYFATTTHGQHQKLPVMYFRDHAAEQLYVRTPCIRGSADRPKELSTGDCDVIFCPPIRHHPLAKLDIRQIQGFSWK